MRGLVRSAIPWILAFFFAALSGFLLSRAVPGVRESRTVDAAPVVTAIRKIATLATVEAEISDVVRFEEIKSFLIFDFRSPPRSACEGASSRASI